MKGLSAQGIKQINHHSPVVIKGSRRIYLQRRSDKALRCSLVLIVFAFLCTSKMKKLPIMVQQ